MLLFNPKPIIRLRNIGNPRTFLIELGINPVIASKILRGKSTFVKMDHMETICRTLNCTPNELFEWHPDSSPALPEKHRLLDLRSGGEIDRMFEKLKMMSLEEIEQMVKGAEREL